MRRNKNKEQIKRGNEQGRKQDMKEKVKNNFFKSLLILAIAATMCITALIVLPTVSADCPSGMISYWKLDDGSGTIASDFYGPNDGTLVNDPVWATGKVNGALSFDGANDYVEVADHASLDITGAVTVETWIHWNGYGSVSNQIIVSKKDSWYSSGGYILQTGGSSASGLYFSWGNGIDVDNYMHTSMCSANEWHHVVGTYDSGTAKIYIDGILEATEAGQNAMAENNDPLQIGRRGTGDYFSGIIDEVAIYDGALTSDEILGHYYAGLAGHGYCECPDTVYVDDEYTSSSCGGHNWHWDAFATIQEGVDAVCEGGTVYVNGGTYIEQIYITKSLMLEGISSTPKPVIQAPLAASRLTYTIPESGRTFDPIVFADGGTTGISITVDNFEIDGLNDGGSNTFCGILVRNASGAISNSDLHGLKGTGQETMGILMYGTNTDITVSDNTVMDFSRNGITINCGGQADIEGNTVTGDGPLPAGYWAQNGIQAGWGAGGSIIGNTVTGCSYTGSGWAASGILPTASSGTIEIYGNTLQENQVNIYLCECSADIDGNDIYATATGTSQTYFYGIIGDPGSPPNIPKPSPFDEESDGSFATTTYTITCTGNTVESDGSPGGVGIGIYAGMYGTYDIDFTATYNTVRYWEVGFELYEYVPNNLISAEIHYNNIEGNTGYGILNWLSKIYNAECNWWGHCSGPTHSSNPLGCGDDVSDYVDYLPWLDASYPSGNCIGGLCQNTVYVDDDYDCSTPGWKDM